MKANIGFRTAPTGGLGNRLFQYHFLAQVASKLDRNFLFPRQPDAKYLDLPENCLPWLPLTGLLRRREYFSGGQLTGMGGDEIVQVFADTLKRGRSIRVNPPVLGELFFETCFLNPKIFFAEPERSVTTRDAPPYIAVHLRGTDFASWDSRSILPTRYYTDSIEWAFSQMDEGSRAKIFLTTDDETLPAFKEISRVFTRNILPKAPANSLPLRLNAFEDFNNLAMSEVLISSPSTYAIWAGILGNRKLIVHSRQWVDTMEEAGSTFWTNLSQGGNEFYSAAEFI